MSIHNIGFYEEISKLSLNYQGYSRKKYLGGVELNFFEGVPPMKLLLFF